MGFHEVNANYLSDGGLFQSMFHYVFLSYFLGTVLIFNCRTCSHVSAVD